MLLGFAKKNPGMTRVLIGDALVNENERLQVRINQLHDRLEATHQAVLALRHHGEATSGRHRRGGARQPFAVLRVGRWDAVCEERLQARSDGVLERTVEAACSGVIVLRVAGDRCQQ